MAKKRRRRKTSKRRGRVPKGKNYRTEKYVEYIFHAEMGVLQAATILSDLTDGEVLSALRKLVARIRSDGLPRYREQPMDTEGLVAWLVVQEWERLFQRSGRLSRQDMVGVLNTVIESAEAHVSTPRRRSYLNYLKKFMKRAGVTVDRVLADEIEFEDEIAEEELFYDFDSMSLAELGELMVKEPDLLGADDAFENRTHAKIRAGEADEVIAICRSLLEATDHPYVRAILYTVLGSAYRHQGDLEQAVEMFQSAQSPELTSTDAWDKLAETYREMGEYEQAIQTWRKCLEGLPPREGWFVHEEIASTYREMGDLAGEEAALRDLVEARKQRGCLFLTRDSMAALAQLADCLRRRGRESEAQSLAARIRRMRPHIRGDRFEDWAYWVREWMLIDEQDVPLSRLADVDGQEPGPVHWVPVLRAVLYDQIGRPGDAVSFWRRVRREIAGTPYAWVLIQTRDILGDLLPPSSQLFEMADETRD